MNNTSNCIKRYELSIKDKTKIWFQNYEFGMPIVETLKNTKFDTITEFADRLSYYHDREKEQDFLFTLQLEPEIIEPLKEYLKRHKKFIYNYTISKEKFLSSYVYQLFLQYIPYELTDVEKSVFLDAYINMVTDMRGRTISDQRRKLLEKKLSINQG